MKNNFFTIFCMLFLSVAVRGYCDHAAAGEKPEEAPVFGDRIIFGSIGEASNLIPYITTDSASHEVADLLFVAPLRYNGDLRMEPWAAEHFSMEEDGRLLRFTLRKGILWEDGQELTAEDVAFTYRIVIDPATASPYADDFL
ncbi:MAG: ABC transporter substrate-binding protein, partial [Desulfovibrio sp.]|nr:ABC transporter substrate-binding protein [Desulfovibrio sp.]